MDSTRLIAAYATFVALLSHSFGTIERASTQRSSSASSSMKPQETLLVQTWRLMEPAPKNSPSAISTCTPNVRLLRAR